MATGNLDCSISDRICSLQQLNLNVFNDSDISDCIDRQSCLSMQPSTSSNMNTSFKEPENIENFNECAIDDNNYEIKQFNKSPLNSKDCYSIAIDSNKNSLCHENVDKHDSYAIFQTPNVIPEELFINVESDDEGVHSWRPNMSSNALCADFFVTPGLVCEDMNLNLPFSLQNKIEDKNENNDNSLKWTSEILNSPLMRNSNIPHIQMPNQVVNYSKMDMSRLLRAQIAGLNNVKYETINARRRIVELKEEILKLTRNLHEKLVVQRTLDVEKLKEENDQLRIECQCLCMEVDFYLKGRAPLGEIDETFYQENSQQEKNASSSQDVDKASSNSTPPCSSDNLDGNNEWECCACTFANHPAINSCEICQAPRSHRNLSHSSFSDSKDSCFCHPKTDYS